MNETITIKDGQAAVTTTAVSGELSPKSSATDIITVVKTANGDQAAVKVVDLGGGGGGGGDFLPLSGGRLTGSLYLPPDGKTGIRFESDNPNVNTRIVAMDGRKISIGDAPVSNPNEKGFMFDIADGVFYHHLSNFLRIGKSNKVVKNIYVSTLNNGADIAIPTEGGTMARIEDIDAAVGDISTALTAILGE